MIMISQELQFRMNTKQENIDIVIPWVDPTDPVWQKEHKFMAESEGIIIADDSDARYRDWDIIKYFFRSVDKCMPWVRKIHFVTYGHIPEWLNTESAKLHIVKHSDFIPKEYLPTYSSHTIELNMHRIEGLAEQFIYFNDDIVVLRKLKPSYFFKHGLPCDYAVLYPLISDHRYSAMDIALTDIEIVNDYYSPRESIKSNPLKWFNPKYGVHNLQNFFMLPWPRFSHLYGKHLCNSFLKTTFEEVWSKEQEVLNDTCSHHFRTKRDINQWVMREWQLAKGSFYPTSPKRGQYYGIKNNNSILLDDIRKRKYKIVCINDNNAEPIIDFEKTKKEITDALEDVFPEKSSFEK